LVAEVEAAAQAERAALKAVEAAQQAVAEADAARDAADREARAAARARGEAAEAERHARWVIQQRRAAPDEGPSAERRAHVEAAIATERRLTERAERERAERRRRLEHEQARLAGDEQLNPLAQEEYREAVAHVQELERQREDMETAMRELQSLIRDTDRRIQEAFEETFAAAAANFEEVVELLFPGGRGALRLVRDDAGPR